MGQICHISFLIKPNCGVELLCITVHHLTFQCSPWIVSSQDMFDLEQLHDMYMPLFDKKGYQDTAINIDARYRICMDHAIAKH